MRLVIVCCLVVCACISTASAEQTVREFSWSELKKTGQLAEGEIQPDDTGMREDLCIENSSNEEKTVVLLDISPLFVGGSQKSARLSRFVGYVRCKDLEKNAYINMEIWHANGHKESTCAQQTSNGGKLLLYKSQSDREYILPIIYFYDFPVPARIVLNVVLEGRGKIYLSPPFLLRDDDPLHDPWWRDQDAGQIGGFGGSVLGVLGALIGVLGGFGVARRLVMTLLGLFIMLGLASLAIGVIALALGQPYAVYYPLLLAGFILPVVGGGILPAIRHGYQQRELRKMAAMDSH